MIALSTKLSAGEHGCQAPQPGHCVAILLLHIREGMTVLHVFHMNRTKCLATSCKNMYIKLSPCSQGHDVYLFSIASFFLHSGSSAGVLHVLSVNSTGVAETCSHSNTLVSGTQMLYLSYVPPTWQCLGRFRISQVLGTGRIDRSNGQDNEREKEANLIILLHYSLRKTHSGASPLPSAPPELQESREDC